MRIRFHWQNQRFSDSMRLRFQKTPDRTPLYTFRRAVYAAPFSLWEKGFFSIRLIWDKSMVCSVCIFWQWKDMVFLTAFRCAISRSRSSIFSRRSCSILAAERFCINIRISSVETFNSRKSRMVSNIELW